MNTIPKSLGCRWLAAALSGAFFLAGCERTNQSKPPPPPPEVGIVTVKPQDVMLTAELPGRTTAFRIAEIRPQVSGLILKRLFEEGSNVKAGDALYQIDPAPFQAALDSAKAALRRSEATGTSIALKVKRLEKLVDINAVSQQDYDDALSILKRNEADIDYWKAALETSRIDLGYTTITAPISGRIGKSSVTEGAIVTAFQPVPLGTIQQLDPIYVDVPQSTNELLRLKRLMKDGRIDQSGKNQSKVKLLMADGTAYPLEGTLQFSDVTVDPTTGCVILRIVFPNPKDAILPGMFVRAVINEGLAENAILIPQQSVSRDHKGIPTALTVDSEGVATKHMLTLNRAIGANWLVSDGLAPGDRVIAERTQMLRPGMKVVAVSFKETEHPSEGADRSTAESK